MQSASAGVGVGVGVSVGSGSRYKVTARCVPEVSITSPTSQQQQQQQLQQQHEAPNKHITLLRSRSQPTSNSIFSPGLGIAVGNATLVEEEDFSLLTAAASEPVNWSASGSGKNVLQRQLATTTQLEEQQQKLNQDQDQNQDHDRDQEQQQSAADIEAPNELTPLVEERYAAAAAAATAPTGTTSTATTANSYSHNSKTTRSWPVIYRNPHHCDYEALYVQQQQQSTPAQQSSQQSFKQNCYSNQFKQSIVYSSSNEELPAAGPELAEIAPRQTTCYYFAPSRHNSIYEHPSSVVGGSLQFDAAAGSAATTAAAAAAVESLRRSNSILLRQNSCAKVIQRRGSGSAGAGAGGAALDTSTSLSSHMDGLGMGSGTGAAACCSSCCMGPPPVLFLFVTLLMTTSATAMLCAAIMTDHWEHVTWDRHSLDRYSNRSGLHLDWLLDEKVAVLKPDKKDHRYRRDSVFLVPMHGGIWTLCIDLPMQQLQELRRNPKFPRGAPPCVNYLAGSMENARGEEQRNDWQHSESQVITLQPHLSTYYGAILP
ncbi:hypothetical protein ACLKA7_007945 [Drosophila subpalustris]